LLIGIITNSKWRNWVLMVVSILVIYWLQPITGIRHLDFWLPTTSIALVIITWIITRPDDTTNDRTNLITGLVIAAMILILCLPRYFGSFCCLTPSRPPAISQVLLVIGLLVLISLLIGRFKSGHSHWINGFSLIILGIFVVLKFEPLTEFAASILRSINGQSVDLGSATDIRWLGFSFLAFRLLHTLRDRIAGKLPILTLQEYVIYTIFYPSFTAGPIDRVQRFVQNLHQPYKLSIDSAIFGGKRILQGFFYKFVIADTLALFALNNTNAGQVTSSGWLWIILYAFAFRIFFDFSGYTDIAIGIGYLVGIQLPENFEKPYRKQNLTLFWNSWHMTLAGWFRAYFFNPLTRTLRSHPASLPLPLIIFIGQMSTFILIGLWHGITWNFAIWGAWHGFGLFLHNRWSDLVRPKASQLDSQPRIKQVLSIGSTILTFNYVCLGWVWFALSTPYQSWNVFLKLFGLG
jgi:D-alanyl-lipoteichoic acid acyltransferase DltB (MBOAT superfamily)